MNENAYYTTVRGFDVSIEAVEGEDAYKVGVMEGDGVPWEIQINVNLDDFEGDNESLDGSDAIMTHVAEAAVGFFEAERGTLGQGAGATDNDGVVAMKKQSLYCMSEDWEDWFYKMQGTPFEDEATHLLEQLLATQLIPYEDKELERLEQEQAKISYDLDMLNLRRMKECGDSQTIIVIGSSNYNARAVKISPSTKRSYWCFESIESYLEKFEGTKLEAEAISKVQELLDIQKDIDSLETSPSRWDKEEEIRGQMNELSLMLMQQNAMPPSSEVGPESNLAKDMMEIVEDVELPVAPSLSDIGRDPLPIEDMVDSMNKRRDPEGILPPVASGVKLAFEDVEPVADRIDELGHVRKDLDPALIKPEQYAFNTNERVELTKEIEARVGWGSTKKYPKGTKGYTESLYDKHADYYVMRTDDNQLIKVRWDEIKSIAK